MRMDFIMLSRGPTSRHNAVSTVLMKKLLHQRPSPVPRAGLQPKSSEVDRDLS